MTQKFPFEAPVNDNLPLEVWRKIPSLPEYLASSLGRIMRDPWHGQMPHGGIKHYGGTPTYGVWQGVERRFFINFRGKNYKVSRLVCEAFHGEPPFEDAVCMHLDENSRNNRQTNLQWGTQKENLNAPGFIKYCQGRTGDNSPTIKHRKATSNG